MSGEIPSTVLTDIHALGVELPEGALPLLAEYLDLLLETNEQFNLTAIKDRDHAWRRHIVDSLTLVPFLEPFDPGAAVIDVGSGGGLPGIPLAIARPDLKVTLLEATGKKAKFLERCAKELPLPGVRVLNMRAEDAGQERALREKFDAATCRAVGPMRELLEYTLPLVAIGGLLLAMKGKNVEAELNDAGDALSILGAGELQIVDAYPEGFAGGEGAIVSITKERPTPQEYPRLAGTPRREPL